MSAIYTEFEFEHFEHTSGVFYQALKSIPTIILYREEADGLEKLSVIVLNDRYRKDVKKLARTNQIKIVSIHDVPHDRLEEVERGLFPVIDGWDTRTNNFWLGKPK